MATLYDQYKARENTSSQQINDLYGKKLAATQQGLTSQYEADQSNLQAKKDQIAPQYQTQANALSAVYNRNLRNSNLNAMTSGMGSGLQQQQMNALRNQYTNNYGALRGEEAGATTDINRNIANLSTAYNSNMANAALSNQADLDAALIKNSNENRDWYENYAKNLANYGIFDDAKNIYGDSADQMQKMWIAQNPMLAYRTGKITAEQYKNMTGANPV